MTGRFFDLLPVLIKSRSGYRIKLKLFTVPGQVIHAATRRLVLQGADGVVFVGDSQLSEARANGEFLARHAAAYFRQQHRSRYPTHRDSVQQT